MKVDVKYSYCKGLFHSNNWEPLRCNQASVFPRCLNATACHTRDQLYYQQPEHAGTCISQRLTFNVPEGPDAENPVPPS